jgi:hypothetical protein
MFNFAQIGQKIVGYAYEWLILYNPCAPWIFQRTEFIYAFRNAI